MVVLALLASVRGSLGHDSTSGGAVVFAKSRFLPTAAPTMGMPMSQRSMAFVPSYRAKNASRA
jgi:hypothetical protein